MATKYVLCPCCTEKVSTRRLKFHLDGWQCMRAETLSYTKSLGLVSTHSHENERMQHFPEVHSRVIPTPRYGPALTDEHFIPSWFSDLCGFQYRYGARLLYTLLAAEALGGDALAGVERVSGRNGLMDLCDEVVRRFEERHRPVLAAARAAAPPSPAAPDDE